MCTLKSFSENVALKVHISFKFYKLLVLTQFSGVGSRLSFFQLSSHSELMENLLVIFLLKELDKVIHCLLFLFVWLNMCLVEGPRGLFIRIIFNLWLASPRGFSTPPYVLYAYDIMIFCSCTKKNLQNLSLLMQNSILQTGLLMIVIFKF